MTDIIVWVCVALYAGFFAGYHFGRTKDDGKLFESGITISDKEAFNEWAGEMRLDAWTTREREIAFHGWMGRQNYEPA